jgi:hypothetical protein
MIHDAVLAQLNTEIPLQNQNELVILMRNVQINNTYTPNVTIDFLNSQVVSSAVSRIAPKLDLSKFRGEHIWESPVPMAHPVNVSAMGQRVGQYNIS